VSEPLPDQNTAKPLRNPIAHPITLFVHHILCIKRYPIVPFKADLGQLSDHWYPYKTFGCCWRVLLAHVKFAPPKTESVHEKGYTNAHVEGAFRPMNPTPTHQCHHWYPYKTLKLYVCFVRPSHWCTGTKGTIGDLLLLQHEPSWGPEPRKIWMAASGCCLFIFGIVWSDLIMLLPLFEGGWRPLHMVCWCVDCNGEMGQSKERLRYKVLGRGVVPVLCWRRTSDGMCILL
jgi:hypothetical protein